MALANRLAIIAGGLGGIASATSHRLLAQSAHVALLHHPAEAASASPALDALPREHRARVRAYACDITSRPSVAAAFAAVETDTPAAVAPSILVNAAGYVSLAALLDQDPADAAQNLNVNVLGPMWTGQAFAQWFLRGGARGAPGRIVNMSSQAGHVALPLHGAYCASKAGLMGLTRVMALEWGGRGITANTVSPTVVWTALGKKAWADDRVREAFQEKIPTGRFAEPDEVASAVEYLCSDAAGMINGADLRVDGGFTIA